MLQAAADDLEESTISIHLLNEEYHEAAHLECEVAGQRAEDGRLERFVWIGVDRDPGDPVLTRLFDDVEAAPAGTQPFRQNVDRDVQDLAIGGP